MRFLKIALITIVAMSFVFSFPLVASSMDKDVVLSVVDEKTGQLKTCKLKIRGNVVTDMTGCSADGEVTKLKLNGKDVISVTDDTIIHTQSSPGCSWYFFNNRWYEICS